MGRERFEPSTRRIVEEYFDQARALPARHRAQLRRLAAALVERETLDEAEAYVVAWLSPQAKAGLRRVARTRAWTGKGAPG